MPLPGISYPMDYLVRQIQTDLTNAANVCEEIKQNRHCGSSHVQLDNLESTLSSGPAFVRTQWNGAQGLEGADVDGGDDVSRAKFAAYISQVEEITTRLQNIAHPPTHQHHHHHEPLFFPSLSAPHHKEKEDPHFHDLLLKYEGIRDGVSQTFSELAYRLQNVKKAKEKEDKAKEKAEKEKKEAVEKVEKEKQELEKKVEKVEEHKDEIIEKKEKMEEKRDKAVEQVVEDKLSEDPIKNLDRLGTVMGNIQRSLTPSPWDRRGRGRSCGPVVIHNSNAARADADAETVSSFHPHHRRHSHHHPHHHHIHHHDYSVYSPSSSSSESDVEAAPRQTMITNVIEGSVSDLEEGNGNVVVHNGHSRHGGMGTTQPQRVTWHGREGTWFPFGQEHHMHVH